MHIVTLALRRDESKATVIDAEAFAQKLMAMDDVAGVEHARVVVEALRVHVVLFLLAPTYCQAHAAALRICRLALASAALAGWAVEDPAAGP
jgi:hypothetical protein